MEKNNYRLPNRLSKRHLRIPQKEDDFNKLDLNRFNTQNNNDEDNIFIKANDFEGRNHLQRKNDINLGNQNLLKRNQNLSKHNNNDILDKDNLHITDNLIEKPNIDNYPINPSIGNYKININDNNIINNNVKKENVTKKLNNKRKSNIKNISINTEGIKGTDRNNSINNNNYHYLTTNKNQNKNFLKRNINNEKEIINKKICLNYQLKINLM